MAAETSSEPGSIENGWNDATLALLVGVAVFGTMVYHVAVNQPPGLPSPPVEAIPLFVFNTTAAVIGFMLLSRGNPWGYGAAVVTGVLVFVSIVLIGTGIVGSLPSGANPLGPLSYAALGVVLVVTAVVAWRRGSVREPAAAPKPTGE